MDPARQEFMAPQVVADHKSGEEALKEKQKELVDKLKELTTSDLLRWEAKTTYNPREFYSEINDVKFELNLDDQRLSFNASEIKDTRGLLDELVWAIEAQLRPTSSSRSYWQNSQDEIQEVLDKLNS